MLISNGAFLYLSAAIATATRPDEQALFTVSAAPPMFSW